MVACVGVVHSLCTCCWASPEMGLVVVSSSLVVASSSRETVGVPSAVSSAVNTSAVSYAALLGCALSGSASGCVLLPLLGAVSLLVPPLPDSAAVGALPPLPDSASTVFVHCLLSPILPPLSRSCLRCLRRLCTASDLRCLSCR